MFNDLISVFEDSAEGSKVVGSAEGSKVVGSAEGSNDVEVLRMNNIEKIYFI